MKYSKEELLEHIEMLEHRYEPIYQDRYKEEKWMSSWDELLSKFNNGKVEKLFFEKKHIDNEYYKISKDDVMEMMKKCDKDTDPLDCLIEYTFNNDEDDRNGDEFVYVLINQ